jgi:hypothetical protein
MTEEEQTKFIAWLRWYGMKRAALLLAEPPTSLATVAIGCARSSTTARVRMAWLKHLQETHVDDGEDVMLKPPKKVARSTER